MPVSPEWPVSRGWSLLIFLAFTWGVTLIAVLIMLAVAGCRPPLPDATTDTWPGPIDAEDGR